MNFVSSNKILDGTGKRNEIQNEKTLRSYRVKTLFAPPKEEGDNVDGSCAGSEDREDYHSRMVQD